MSSYNNIEKIKYASADCVVTLREYIVFEDERAEEKFVVFKFSNNVSQQLLGMEFEVSQYDIDGNLVEKSVVIYNKFLAKPDQPFVPNAKLKVNYLCKTLSVRLVQAAFDRFIWKEGKYLDNSYKFEHYARDEDTEAAKYAAPVKQVKVKEPKPDPAPKRRKGKLPFTAKNSMRKNIARFPGVFNFFVCILIFVAIGLSIYFFNDRSTSFTLDNYDLKILDANTNTVTVTGYEGDGKNITIPATIGEYTVVRISGDAFKNSEITSVKFNSPSLYIESSAFEGCKSLKTVSSSGEITVTGYAFKDCTRLESITLPNSILFTNSLANCTKVSYLEFGKTSAVTLSALFGGNAPATVPVIITNEDNLPYGFFEDGGSTGFIYDANKTYAYGELYGKGVAGYTRYNDFETVDGIIITVNPAASEDLVISNEVKGISEKVISDLYRFRSLKVEGETVITPDIAVGFANVTSIDVANEISVQYSLSYFGNARYLSLPCYKEAPLNHQYDFSAGSYYVQITLKPTDGCKTVPSAAFSGVYVSTIVIEAGFTDCGSNIVSYDSFLTSITLPKGITYGYYNTVIGDGCTNLETVDVYLDNFNSYEYFNRSYKYTKTLIIRTEYLSGYNYLQNSYYYIDCLEIHATAYSINLRDFISYDDFYVYVNTLKIYIENLYDTTAFLSGVGYGTLYLN
ncbi:MAG: leucine-rich repeat domain-containing protein [Clostridia bacterium]|nr:leucine-rich repeat domain-containing protein [Clostridia bacterium]